jgi:hypothetical protein
MNISQASVIVVAAIASFSASARAADADVPMQIARLEASSSADHGFRVYPHGTSLPDLGCAKRDFAEVAFTTDVHVVGLMNKTLMAALAASRPIRLYLSGCGSNGRPAHKHVTLQSL